VTFNEWLILAITQAICDYRKLQKIDGPLFLGIDTHALSEPAFASAMEVLAANNVEVMISEGTSYTPTPAVSHAILVYNRGRQSGLADGIVITPSHNPPDDGGFKYDPPHGGPADSSVTSWVESKANDLLEHSLDGVKRTQFAQALRASTTHKHNFLKLYIDDRLYELLEKDVIPEFYSRDGEGIPRRWVARMRESMARLTPTFSTNRVVRQYTEDHYLSAATGFRERAENRGSVAAELVAWQAELAKHWSALRFGPATLEQQGEQYLFRVQVFLNYIDPDGVRVELYAEAQKDGNPSLLTMNRDDSGAEASGALSYSASVPASRPVADYTSRLVPHHAGAFVPLEAPFILWHEKPSWR
jgi:hypothetical protein